MRLTFLRFLSLIFLRPFIRLSQYLHVRFRVMSGAAGCARKTGSASRAIKALLPVHLPSRGVLGRTAPVSSDQLSTENGRESAEWSVGHRVARRTPGSEEAPSRKTQSDQKGRRVVKGLMNSRVAPSDQVGISSIDWTGMRRMDRASPE